MLFKFFQNPKTVMIMKKLEVRIAYVKKIVLLFYEL